ncbi:MAG: LppX LprAFG lipoprotein [Nocardioides sp.]|nr:LppX LprAFG lipoprotein [Nocardioides sp.]
MPVGLVLAVTGPWLVGCGGGDAPGATPTPVVIPGSTVTVGTEAVTTAPPTEPTSEPTRRPRRTPSPTPSVTPTDVLPAGAVATVEELLELVGAAVGAFETVRLTVADGSPVGAAVADHRYLGGNDFVAGLDVLPDQPVQVRRVGGTLYAKIGAEPWVVPPVPAEDDTAALADLPRWDVLADLRAALSGATGFEPLGPADVDGTAVQSYAFTVDAAGLADGAQVPDLLSGPVETTFSVDEDGLPVRVDQLFVETGQLLRTDYSAWGLEVVVAAPRVG